MSKSFFVLLAMVVSVLQATAETVNVPERPEAGPEDWILYVAIFVFTFCLMMLFVFSFNPGLDEEEDRLATVTVILACISTAYLLYRAATGIVWPLLAGTF